MDLALNVLATRDVPAARWAPKVRWFAGTIFLVFGIGKFTSHASEVASFEDYGLPAPDAFVYAIGCLEMIGGALLLVGLGTRFVALALAGNMIAAIALSGIGEGEVIPSLTLAPLLLAGMIVLIWTGAGPRSLDERAARELSSRGTDTGSGRCHR
jgi:putative oxidoreductase